MTGLFGGNTFGAAQPASGSLFGTTTAATTGGLFGTAAPATPAAGSLFGTAAPATPATSNLFGAATPPASTGLFGAPAAPVSTGIFGAPASTSLFGASAPATTGLFGAPATASGGLFGGAVAVPVATGGGLFGTVAPAAPAPQAAAATPQLLIGKDGQPVTRKTVFDNLPDEMQAYLKSIEVKMRTHSNQSASLKVAMENADSLAQHHALQQEAMELQETLKQVKAWLESDMSAACSFHAKVAMIIQHTEQTQWKLTVNKARRDAHTAQQLGQQNQQQQQLPSSDLLNATTQPISPYLGIAVAGCWDQLCLLRDLLTSLEAHVPVDGPSAHLSASTQPNHLPTVLRDLHEIFLHTAARVAEVDRSFTAHRAAYLASHRSVGDYYDPFAEADERDATRAAEGVLKPLPRQLRGAALQVTPSQPVTAPAQGGGVFGSTSAPGTTPLGSGSSAVFGGSPVLGESGRGNKSRNKRVK